MNIEIIKAEEPWVVLHLADGSILKARVNIAAVERLEGQYDAAGKPVYNFQQNIMIVLIPHESLVRKPDFKPSGTASALSPGRDDPNASRAAAELLMRGNQ